MSAPTPAKLVLQFPGHTVAVQAGTVLIGLTWIREGVYRVSVNHGGIAGLLGEQIDQAAYADEDEARAEARRMVHAYHAHRTPAALERAWSEAADLAEVWLKRYGVEARRRAVAYERQRDALQPLGVRKLAADLTTRARADIASYAAA